LKYYEATPRAMLIHDALTNPNHPSTLSRYVSLIFLVYIFPPNHRDQSQKIKSKTRRVQTRAHTHTSKCVCAGPIF